MRMNANLTNIKEREIWADYVKAIAIYLMVLCHFNLNSEIGKQFIWIFHMPVFFLISGYFDKGLPFSMDILKKDFRTLIIPYFFFSVCNLTICWVSPYLHPESYHNGTVLQSFGKAVLGMFLMDDVVRPYAFMPCLAAWFLAALFEIKITFALLVICWQKCKILIVPIFLLIAALVYWHFPFFSIDSAGLGLVFYFVGFLFKRFSLCRLIKNYSAWLLFVLTLVYLWFVGMKNGIINIDGGEWGNSVIMLYINGVVGSICCIALSKMITIDIPFISEIGRSTLSILGTHGFIGIVGKTFCVALLHYSPRDFPIMASVFLSIIALIFGVYVHRFLSKYYPIAIGQIKKNNEKNIHDRILN